MHTSFKKKNIPGKISGVKVHIEKDIIDCDLPLLLNRSAMQKAGTKLGLKKSSYNVW